MKRNKNTPYAAILLLTIFTAFASCQFSEGGEPDTVNGEWFTYTANTPNKIVFGKGSFSVLTGDSLDNEIVKGEGWSSDGSIITIKNVMMKQSDGSWTAVSSVSYANYKFEDHTLLLNTPVNDMADLPVNFYKARRLERSDALDLILTAVSINGLQLRSKEQVTVPSSRIQNNRV